MCLHRNHHASELGRSPAYRQPGPPAQPPPRYPMHVIFEDRWYEQRKYAISLALLPAARYRRALESGCSIGVLTRMLAGRCDEVLSCDVAAAAAQAAARRTEGLPHIRVEQRDIPGRWPD